MKRILCFGDSNTRGLTPGSSPAERFPPQVRWTGRLQAQHAELQIIEAGLCGRTTVFEDPQRPGRAGIHALPALLAAHAPLDGLILMLGTNDCKPIYHADPQRITAGLLQCLQAALLALPPERILLIAPPPLGPEVWRPEKDPAFDRSSVAVSRALEGCYAAAAASCGVAFLAAASVAAVSSRDDEHLDAQGHAQLAAAVETKLRKMHLL